MYLSISKKLSFIIINEMSLKFKKLIKYKLINWIYYI